MYTFKNSYFSKFDCKKTYDILGANYIYIVFKTFYLKIPLEEKNLFLGKRSPKKTIVPKCKVNTLTHYMLFGPNS